MKTKQNNRKWVKYIVRSILCLVVFALFLAGAFIWVVVSSEKSRFDQYKDCQCERCNECIDYGDAQWIIVKGIGTQPKGLTKLSPAHLRVMARRSAHLNLSRQLVWCIEGMRLPTGECVANFLKDNTEDQKKIGQLIERIRKNNIDLKNMPDGNVEITLKVARTEVLHALGIEPQ